MFWFLCLWMKQQMELWSFYWRHMSQQTNWKMLPTHFTHFIKFIKSLLFPHDHFFVLNETAFQWTRRSNLNKCNAEWIEGKKIPDVNTNLVTVSNRVNLIYIINTLKHSCLYYLHVTDLFLNYSFFFVPSCFLLSPQVEILSRMRLH